MRKSSKNLQTELSIIIVNYNTGDLLASCLNSIWNSTNHFKTPNLEIILIDNASADNSVKQAQETNIPITLVRNSHNDGYSKSNNQGIIKAEGKYLFLLNPDTKVLKNSLQTIIEFAKKTPNCGVVGARLLNPDGSIQNSVFHFPSVIRAVNEFWFGKKAYSGYVPTSNFPLEVDAVMGAAFLITPQASELAGLLSEKYFMYFEDIDYCRKVHRAGLKVYYLPEAQIVHYHGISGKNLADSNNQWRRLVPSSKLYHGWFKHELITFVIRSGTKFRKIFS